MVKIHIENCNNIKCGDVTIEENKLNIKYAHNGTGKTTIVKAMKSKIDNNEGSLLLLSPFTSSTEEKLEPQITGVECFNTVRVFDETYVNQYVFQSGILLPNSFDVFIRTPAYDLCLTNIKEQVSDIRNAFIENDSLNILLTNLAVFINNFGNTNSGLARNSVLMKGIGSGNKLDNIPDELKDYTDFLKKNPTTVSWLKWQIGGNAFSDISCKCPYCTNNIELEKPKIKMVSDKYKSNDINHLIKIFETFDALSPYFSKETNITLKDIFSNIDGMSNEQINYLKSVKTEVESLRWSLEKVKNIGFDSLKNVDSIIDEIKTYKIDESNIVFLDCAITKDKINDVNSLLEQVLATSRIIQGQITLQNNGIQTAVEKYKKEINEFLNYAGYSYEVDLKKSGSEEIKLTISHVNAQDKDIDNARDYLSYGERNAFALVLFMYDTINSNPDLIILDDPISSFDGTKKFAILHKLFMGGRSKSFCNRTVILLTHEFSTIIDTIYNFPINFNAPYAAYLENRDNKLTEKLIKKKNIQSFNDIALNIIARESDCQISKLIYLRRYFELHRKKDYGYQLLSSYFHRNLKPTYKDMYNGETRDMTVDEIKLGNLEIGHHIEGFDYDKEIELVNNDSILINIYKTVTNNYEKLQIFRMIDCNRDDTDSVINKFINETYHIENDYVFQLDPTEYEIIPDYIIKKCDKILSL